MPNSSGFARVDSKATTMLWKEKKKGSGVGAERARRDTTRGAGSPSRALRPGREVVGDARPFDAGIRDRPRATHRPPREPPPPARLRFRPV